MLPALHQEGLFRVNGNARAVQSLRLRLEGGEDVDLLAECDTCTVASLLKQYLRDLPEGLVNSAVQQELIQHYQGRGTFPVYSLNPVLPDGFSRLFVC